MVQNIICSGVILTRNLENFDDCININYHEGKNSETVTSGKKGSKKIIFFENKKFKIPDKFKKLYSTILEIKKITKEKDLDIEFAINKKKKIYILQVRKLIIPKKNRNNFEKQNCFNNLEKKIIKLKQPHPSLYGKTTFFGVMPDWNPAEIIGTKPRPLALSLYQELITDHVWAKNRASYGFKELDQFHLMTTFYGTPYVDIRIDFNSWLPINLNKRISNKIVNYYLNEFKKKPNLHDKLEFKLLFTCATFSTIKNLKNNLQHILTKNEIKIFYNELKKINILAIKNKDKDINKIRTLIHKQSQVSKTNLYEIDKIYWLIEDCKKYGTLPFAGLARCGFIAIELLNSLVEENIITEKQKSRFLLNVSTVTSELKIDVKKMKKTNFLMKYGHLRPGTYDILSKNYTEYFNKYFQGSFINHKKGKKNHKKSLKNKSIKINLKNNKLFKSNYEMLKFIKESIAYREYSKFIFSKSIDKIFKNLIKFGKKYNISREDLSFVKINKIMDMYFNISNFKTIENLKKHIAENKKEYYLNKNILLPDVIKEPKDLYVQLTTEEKINFISNKKTTSKIIKFDKNKINKNYDGIVCIENADPGYDFLFNKNIKGLITKYGGLNSHMAIRCSELNLPALIGVGENNFDKITKSKIMKIDCDEKKIELIN